MTVEQLMEQLQEMSPDATVIIQMDVRAYQNGEEVFVMEQRVPSQFANTGDYIIIAE